MSRANLDQWRDSHLSCFGGGSAPKPIRMRSHTAGDAMSVRRGRSELQAGVDQLEKLWDNMVEKHLSERTKDFMIRNM